MVTVKKTSAGTAAKLAPKSSEDPAAKAKAVPAAEVPSATVEGAAAAVEKASVELKLRDLVGKVVATTGVKKPQVRSTIDAVLKELGAALAAGQVLNLPGLGKARVVRAAEVPGGVMTIKLRQPNPNAEKPADSAAEPLAEAGEDS